MPLFPEGQDPLDVSQGQALRAPLGAPEADPFGYRPDLGDTLAAAFRQNNPIVSVIEGVNARSPNQQVDPNYNPLAVLKGTPFEQDPSAFLGDANESVTRSRMAQMRQEESDRRTLALSGTPGVVAALGAGLLDPSFYVPLLGEAHAAEAGLGFLSAARRMAMLGGGQAAISETALLASQQSRSWKESAGNIATNTLLMGFLGGALGHLSPAERAEAEAGLEETRRSVTPVDPADPSSLSLRDAEQLGSQAPQIQTTPDGDQFVLASVRRQRGMDFEGAPREIIGYHGTGAPAFDNFDPNAGHIEPERGANFFAVDPRLAESYASNGGDASRIYKVRIDPGKTQVFDLPKILQGDGGEAFLSDVRRAWIDGMRQRGIDVEGRGAEIDAAWQDTVAKIYSDLKDQGEINAAFESGRSRYGERVPLEMIDERNKKAVSVAFDSAMTGAVLRRAKRLGLDTAVIRGMREGQGARATDQIMVLDPDRIRPFWMKPEDVGASLDTAAQDALAMARTTSDEPAARTRPQSATEAGADPSSDLALRNPRTGEVTQAQEVTSLKDAFQRFDVSRNADVDMLTRASSMALGDRLKRLIGDMKVFTVGPEEMRALAAERIAMQPGFEPAGFYDRLGNHIVVLDDALRDPREAASLLVHEGLHGAFMQTINESEAARNIIDHLRDTATAAHMERGGEARDHYGLTNAHEFVSEAFSNSEFQRFLASIPADERTVQAFGLDKAPGYSLWDVFVAAVRKILGMAPDQHSLLDATMRLGQLLEDRRAEVTRGPNNELAPMSQRIGGYSYQGDALPSARPAGAAPVDERDLVLKSFGIDKVPGLRAANAKLSPNLRIYSGSSVQAKRAAADIADTSLRFTMHDRGVPTTEGGTLESAVRVDKARYQTAGHDVLRRAWIDHRYGGVKPGTARGALDTIGDLRGQTPDGKLSYKDFKSAVYDAAYSGDQHPIPEVAQASREIRAKVLDPVAQMAKETLGPDGRPMLGEALSPPKGDKSFVPRMWNHEAVIAKRDQLRQIITNWLDGEQTTKAAARDRISDFVDDLRVSSARLSALGEDDPARAQEQATHDAVRSKIEKELGDWQGSSSAEAKAAIKARQEAEVRRQARMDEGTYQGRGERLTSADDAVDGATRRILASDRDLSRSELTDRADEIIDRIIGSPDGRIPYDAASGGPRIGYTGGPKNEVRGSLRSRDFAIPTELVKDFVQRDLEHVVSSYLRTMLPDIQLTRRFGDVDMTDTFRRIQEEYARKITAEKSEAESRQIHAQRDSDIRDVAALRDRLRGVYGWNPDPTARKLGAIVRDFHASTSLSSLGTSVANRLTDIGAQAVMRYGIANVFNEAWRPFFKSMLGMSPLGGEAKRQAREMGVGIDGLLGHLRHNLSDINDNYLPGNKFSRGLAWANDRSMLVNLHGPWTDWMKAMAWVPAQAELGRLVDRVAQGSATEKDMARLADANISPQIASRISEQLAAHSIVVDSVRLADAGQWTDRGAREAFERAMSREAGINVTTAGIGQKPLFLSKPLGGLIGQFKSFVAGAHENILISNLQQRDGRTMQGALVSMMMGMLSYRLYTLLAGQDASPRPQDWIKEGLARSALTGWFNEANNTLAKFTAGKIDYNRLYGADRPLTRRTENSPLSELLGPTYARMEGLTGIVTHVLSGHGSAADIHKARQFLPLQNLMGARIGFDNMEDGISNSLGLKPRNHSPHDWPQ